MGHRHNLAIHSDSGKFVCGGSTGQKSAHVGAAKKIAEAAEADAKQRGATVVIAVVDDAGHLLVLNRLDDTQVASVDVGVGKARTAAIFRRPSKVFEDQIREGRVAALALPGGDAIARRRAD